MGTTRKQKAREVLLKPAKISKTRFSQLKKLWEQDCKKSNIRIPFVPWLRDRKIAYIALDWQGEDSPELEAPMLSFFRNLPSRDRTSRILNTLDFVSWMPLSKSQAKGWNEDKAYSVESLFEKENKNGK